MTVTGVDMNRDGIPDVLQQQQAYGAQQAYGTQQAYAAPQSYGHQQQAYGYGAPTAGTMTVTGVDMNRDGILDVLQQQQYQQQYQQQAVYAEPGAAPVKGKR